MVTIPPGPVIVLVIGAGSGGGLTADLRAMSSAAPVLAAVAVAVWFPVADCVVLVKSAVSMSRWDWLGALDWSSPRSVVPLGGVKVAEPVFMKIPTIISLAALGVTLVAVIEVVAVLSTWPLLTSTGVVVSTPR